MQIHWHPELNFRLPCGAGARVGLHRGGVFVCRVALAGRFANQEAAEKGLDRRLKAWIEDYENRPQPDDGAELPS